MRTPRTSTTTGPIAVGLPVDSYSDAQSRRTGVIAAVLVLCMLVAPSHADMTQGDLVIQANGFSDHQGQAVANLFRKGDDVLRKPYLQATSAIQEGTTRLVFPKLPYGDYAVSVFHDANSNGEIDHNWMHFPAEQLGFSNGFRIGLTSGFPSFEKLHFVFSVDTKPLEITVR